MYSTTFMWEIGLYLVDPDSFKNKQTGSVPMKYRNSGLRETVIYCHLQEFTGNATVRVEAIHFKQIYLNLKIYFTHIPKIMF